MTEDQFYAMVRETLRSNPSWVKGTVNAMSEGTMKALEEAQASSVKYETIAYFAFKLAKEGRVDPTLKQFANEAIRQNMGSSIFADIVS